MKLDKALKRLEKSRKKLQEEQGRVARRNAREKFLRHLRAVREAVDEDYPVIRKRTTKRRKRDPKRAVRHKVVIPRELHRRLLSAGIRPSSFVERGNGASITVWAPKWMKKAHDAGFTVKTIAKAARSGKTRRRMMATIRLGASKKPQPL